MASCRFGEDCPGAAHKHLHQFRPAEACQKQCRCGSRQWTAVIGGLLPTKVICARCGAHSKINTAYARGLESPPRPAEVTAGGIPF